MSQHEEFAVRVFMGDDIVRRYYVVAETDDVREGQPAVR